MLYPLRLEADPLAVDASPWLLDEAMVKTHCRIDDNSEDDNLQVYIAAAILWAESVTHRAVISREHRWVLSRFPCGGDGTIRLPRGRCSAVAGIDYSSGGVVTTWRGPSSPISPAGTDYQEDLGGDDGAVLMPPRGSVWPASDCDVPAPVTITFTAGWAAADIPRDLLAAVLLAIADLFDMRGDGNMNVEKGGRTLGARTALASAYILPRIY